MRNFAPYTTPLFTHELVHPSRDRPQPMSILHMGKHMVLRDPEWNGTNSGSPRIQFDWVEAAPDHPELKPGCPKVPDWTPT